LGRGVAVKMAGILLLEIPQGRHPEETKRFEFQSSPDENLKFFWLEPKEPKVQGCENLG
jgi:hypothetical protein